MSIRSRICKGFRYKRKLLEDKNNDVTEFVRFEKGEGIEKKEENFAEEVMKQIK